MKTALITGVNGFVGRHLAELLKSQNVKVFGTSRMSTNMLTANIIDGVIISDLDSKENCIQVIDKIKPDVVFHLAAQSNVKEAWEQPSSTFFTNTVKTMYLFEAVKQVSREIRIVNVGSSEEYGYFEGMEFPLTEDSKSNPLNPYGVSKMSTALLAKQFFEVFDMDIIHIRPFNHIGPGQMKGFVVPDFAHQIVDIERGLQDPVILVGNLSSKRDFTDVRDIVKGYALAAVKGRKGQTYNLCSGIATSIEDLLQMMISLSSKQIDIEVDSNRFRPIDIPLYYGSNDKITKEVCWEKSIDLIQSLNDVLEEIRKEEWLGKR
ncbi:GDP-mannose 4,6-dehydratase [Paenibacillus sp. GM2]|uniref:GDP-mannose 4,6-dehydratase n=1 Tax=Paenibacillus sp. GM2 TaxID=1622070 RepID=UPI000838B80B|nr:GDP-mannose 4,6-dehydratase [Paenibacillus sp. GM2]